MDTHEKKIFASYLTNCSPDKAYEWLKDNWEPYEEIRYGKLRDERVALENLLLERDNRLIDLGLAQYGYSRRALSEVFARGDSGVRCAVLLNPALSLSPDDLKDILEGGDQSEIVALGLNPYHNDLRFEEMIQKKGVFEQLSEDNYKLLLMTLGKNPRLSTPYDETLLDGWAEHSYHNVFNLAWKLAGTVPATQEWAEVLYRLLDNAQPPTILAGMEEAFPGHEEPHKTVHKMVENKEYDALATSFRDAHQKSGLNMIERWRIDPPKKDDDEYYFPEYGFFLRSRLADLSEADESLLNSPDLALRRSFYRRFSPRDFEDWPSFLEKDGEDFVEGAIDNINLWKSSKERYRLDRVAWDCPDPNHYMDMPNHYRFKEQALRKEHPEWFRDEDDEFSTEHDAVTRRIEKLLEPISEKVESLSEEKPKPMTVTTDTHLKWVWLIIGLIFGAIISKFW